MIKFFLKNELFAYIITALFFFGGIFAYFNLPRDEDPGFKIRTAVITTSYKGAKPAYVDEYLTQIIEDELRTIPELEHVRSKSRFGLSTIYIDVFEKYKELQPIWDKARRRLEKIQASLPSGTKPHLDDEFGDVFGILVALSGKDYSYQELKDVADKLRLEFLRLDQVAKVDMHGLKEQAIYIEFDRASLKKYKITPEYLSNYLASYNLISSSGSIQSGDKKIQVFLNENFKSIDDIKKIQIPANGAVLTLEDVFKIEEKYIDPPKNFVFVGADEAIVFAISLKSGGNIFKLEKEVRNLLTNINAKYPIGLNLSIVANQPNYVKYLTEKFTSSLFQSIFIVVFLILLFLGVRIGLIVGFVIPLVVLSSFFVMSKIGVGLEKVSLSALIISLGILVDNSIVISEGYLKRLQGLKEANKRLMNAISYSVVNEFFYPLLVSTTVTVCAFLPISLAKSTVSEYTSSMMKVMALALYFSLFFSATILPHLIKRFYKVDVSSERVARASTKKGFKIEKYFLPALKYATNHPKNVIKLAICLFLTSFLCFHFVPKIFFPDSDRPMFEVKIMLENGVDIYQTRNVVLNIQKFLETIPEIKETSSYIGQGSPRYVLSATPESPKTNYALMIINVKDWRNLDKIIQDVQNFCDKTFDNADIIVRKVPIGPPYDAPVEIRIMGYEVAEIMRIKEQVASILRSVKYVTLVEDDWGDKIPNLTLNINHFELARLGVSNYNLSTSLESYIDGVIVDNFRRKKDNVSLIFALNKNYPLRISDIDTFDFYSEKEKSSIAISQVANVKPDFDYPEIIRRDGLYALTVKAYINKTKTTAHSVLAQIAPKLNKINFKQGYFWEVGGINENSKKGMSSVSRELPVAFGFILLLLIGYFSSLKDTFIIALVALFALTGANFGLFITRSYFGFMTFLGYISLVGMATNNSVVLLDYFKRSFVVKKKITTRDIIFKTKDRIRPICLTVGTTIAGMLPLWIGQDAMFSSMAIAIIFGLLTSTFATIILAPSLFIFFNKIK